jgi:hypothetical protein
MPDSKSGLWHVILDPKRAIALFDRLNGGLIGVPLTDCRQAPNHPPLA